MKKNLIKKVFAVSLSIAMACSFLPAANPVTASAAAPYVSLKTTFKTLKVGQKYKMTLKNNTINWKIKKVETTDRTIAMVYGKTTSQVMIKGKSEGRATVRVHVKTAKRKSNNTKTLRCRVKVVTTTPVVDPTTPTQTDATVTTQAELDAALNNSSITKITIKPTTAVNFVIPKNTYSNVDLIVDAPQSDIENSATFKSITINDIKAETWTENGTGNTFSIFAKAVRLIVGKDASIRNVTFGTKDAKANLVINGGTVAGVNVTAKIELNITGTAAENAALVPVTFGAAAADSVFTTEVPVAVTMSASIELIFEKGAVKSTVKLEVAGIKATITNRTSEAIVVIKNNGDTQSVRAGAVKSTVEAVSTTTTPGNNGGTVTYPGTSTNKPSGVWSINTGSSLSTVIISGTVTGSATEVTASSIKFEIETGDCIVTGGSFETNGHPTLQCTITASQKGADYSWYGSNVATGDMTWNSSTHMYEATIENGTIKGAYNGEPVTFTISVKVKETDSTAPSAPYSWDYKCNLPSLSPISSEG